MTVLMFIFSESILTFIKLLKKYLREILKGEVMASVGRSYFEYRGFRYPINVVVFERKTTLGYFDSKTYQIGVNKHIMYKAKTSILKNLLRHELAHYLTFIEYGEGVKSHGKEFRAVCEKFGWGRDIFAATVNLEKSNEGKEGNLPSEDIISKVRKLLSLSTSSNAHEAKLAATKANQLILQHNLKNLGDEEEDEEIYLERVLFAKKRTGKILAISKILPSFFVKPVFNYGRGIVYLEVIGEKKNVEMADYVAKFLDLELEFLWKKLRGHHRGIRAKNSFMGGVAESFVKKMNLGQKQFYSSKALISIDRALTKKLKLVYPRLQSTGSTSIESEESKNLGKKAGAELTIRKGVNSSNQGVFLPFHNFK
jgi:hypothetical protein